MHLLVDVLDVAAHGLHADAQLAGDFIMLVAFALLTAWAPRSRFIWLLSATAAIQVVVRIPTKSAGDSGRKRPPVPIEAGQGFR